NTGCVKIIYREKEFSINNEDWSPARIKFELEERGLSLAELSRRSGYSPTAAGRALRTSWPAVEAIIAEAIGVNAHDIWPSRYTATGTPKAYQPRRQRRTIRDE
ncbi:MAG: helix-turn-helix domain-containing protein, partial [Pseudomonadota bacterium]